MKHSMDRNELASQLLREYVSASIAAHRASLLVSLPPGNVMLESLDREMGVLLSEGLLDTLSSAYETLKNGAVKLKRVVGSAALTALQRVNDMFIPIVQKAASLATSAPAAAAKLCVSIIDRVARFKDDHPLLFKIVSVVLLTVIIFAIMSFFDSHTAHAGVAKGSKKLSETDIMEMRGYLIMYMDKVKQQAAGGMPDIDKLLDVGNAVKVLDKAAKSPETLDIDTLKGSLGKYLNLSHRAIEGFQKEAASGDPEVKQLLDIFIDLAKKTTIR